MATPSLWEVLRAPQMQGGVIHTGHWKGQECNDTYHHGILQASRGNKMMMQIVKVEDTVHTRATQIYPSGADYTFSGITKEYESVYLSSY